MKGNIRIGIIYVRMDIGGCSSIVRYLGKFDTQFSIFSFCVSLSIYLS